MQVAGVVFGVFLLGCLVSAVLLWRLEKAFVARYPDRWRELSESGFARQYDHLAKLVRGRHPTEDDPAVIFWARWLRYCQFVVFAVWVLLALSVITGIGLREI